MQNSLANNQLGIDESPMILGNAQISVGVKLFKHSIDSTKCIEGLPSLE